MLYGAYVSAAGALASSYRQDVIANNLANVETVSFKRDLALLESRDVASAAGGTREFTAPMLDGIGGGVFALPTHTDFTPGTLEDTGSSLDVALTDRGFFQVGQGSDTRYTRDGRFVLDTEGYLVTQSRSLQVLSSEGQPIKLDRDLDIVIDQQGQISQAGAVVASFGVVDFDDTSALRKLGGNLYSAENGAVAQTVVGEMRQGHLESSGVDILREFMEMMRVGGRFQQNVTMIKMQDQMLGEAVTRLARFS